MAEGLPLQKNKKNFPCNFHAGKNADFTVLRAVVILLLPSVIFGKWTFLGCRVLLPTLPAKRYACPNTAYSLGTGRRALVFLQLES